MKDCSFFVSGAMLLTVVVALCCGALYAWRVRDEWRRDRADADDLLHRIWGDRERFLAQLIASRHHAQDALWGAKRGLEALDVVHDALTRAMEQEEAAGREAVELSRALEELNRARERASSVKDRIKRALESAHPADDGWD